MTRRLPDGSKIIQIDTHQYSPTNIIYYVLFAEDGKQVTVLSDGEEEMLRHWRVDDGHEVGEPIQMKGADIYNDAFSGSEMVSLCAEALAHKH